MGRKPDRKGLLLTALLPLAMLLLYSCRQQGKLTEGNSVYYWRTDLHLDSTERAFLHDYHIKKVYCRYFDVVLKEGEPMPNATITFSDTLPEGVEMVPVVYITEDCMHKAHAGLAEKLVERILQMNETNDIHGVRELQIDCDYTLRSRQNYYNFLQEVRRAFDTAQASSSGTQAASPTPHLDMLSTTIRLHQLSMPVPPVDYGVLMVYNTGDPQKFQERNPILDLRDVSPYLRYLDDYTLPMAAAYPVYLWERHIAGVRIEHTVEAEEILRVKAALEKERPSLARQVLTYHLDKENINRYKTETYEKIYHH